MFVLFQVNGKSSRACQKPHLSSMQSEGQSGSSLWQSRERSRQQPRAPFPLPFIIPSSRLIKVFTMLGKISVCSLWMHIRSLRMAIQRLWMHIPRLRTKIAVRCVNNCSTLHRQSQHATNRTAPRYGNRPILLEAFTHSRQTAAELCKNTGERRSQLPSPPFAKRKESWSTAAQPALCEAKRKQEHSTWKSFSQQETSSCP